MSAIAANREVDGLVRDGVAVELYDAVGVKQLHLLRRKRKDRRVEREVVLSHLLTCEWCRS
ncbi:hypothetical protein MNBD_GAMMA16-1334 [hydrothermal vent metagenome]|uniref:Uncharacterized protein n=1 Tax=hydrothermal vent metagenome TaxID=652676 RepID=A0A3B0ZH27_9ZZZZ